MNDEVVACQSFRELIEQQLRSVDIASDSRHAHAMQTIDGLKDSTNLEIARLNAKIDVEVSRLNELRDIKNNMVRSELLAMITTHITNHMAIHAEQKIAQDKWEKSIDDKFGVQASFREQVILERSEFVRRDVIDERFVAADARVSAMLESFEKRIRPVESFRLQAVGVGAVIIVLVTLIDFILRTTTKP